MRKRVWPVIAGWVFLFSFWSAHATQAATVNIGNAAGLPDTDVGVAVTLSGSEGNVAAVQLDVVFPDNTLTLSPADDCVLADRLSELSLFAFQPETNRARFLVIDLSYPGVFIDDGDLFSCTFHILPQPAQAVAELVGDRFEVSDEFAMPISSSVENGSVSVILCGNGAIDDGEACDDGSLNGTSSSCCTSACQFVPDGTASCDGNECTRPDTCIGGVCTPGSCADGGACTVCGGLCVDSGSSCDCE